MTAPTSSRLNRVALDHYATTQSFADATAQVAGDMWSQVDPDNIADSWARQVPELTAVVSGAQLGAAREADAYVGEALEVQDLSDEAVSTVDPAAFAGTASDGRGLLSLLTHPIVVALLTIADIHDVGRAMGAGRRNLDMIVRTQVADASRLADQTSLVAHPAATGYIRQTDGNPCARCLILAGRFYQWNRGFQRHPRCGCSHVPASSGIQVPDPRSIYDRMSRAERIRAGFSLGDISALDEGADIFQVVNARRGVFTAGGRRFTREGTTRRGFARRRLGRGTPRLTPDQIFADAASREHAQQLLYRHGYLVEAPRPVVLPARMPSGGRATPGAAVQVRKVLADARSPEAVSTVLASEYRRITGRSMLVELRGSVATAREHAEGVLRAVERQPDLRITAVRTGPMQSRRAYAEMDPSARTLIFSDDWSSVPRRDDYLSALAADERSGWSPKGAGNPAGVAVHETGHILDSRTSALDREIDALLFRAQTETGVPIDRAIRSGVSGYAAKNHRELIAEAWSDVVANGARASGLSRAIVRAVEAQPARGTGGMVIAGERFARAQDLSRLPVTRLTAMVRERGITVPTGLRKPALVRLVDDLDSGKSPTLARQQAVLSITDERRAAADALIRAAELGPQSSARALQHVGRVLRRDLPPELQKPFAPLVDALDAADLVRVQAAIPAVARSAKVRQIGGSAGEVKPFKRGEMEWIGDQRGDAVFVIRPGYAATVDGGSVTLRRAAVAPATPEQIAALPAKKAAAPAKKATAAASRQFGADGVRLRSLATQEPSTVRRLASGTTADIDVMEFPGGASAVRKTFHTADSAEIERFRDAEELGSITLRALGLDAPAVVRLPDGRLMMTRVDGRTGADLVERGLAPDAEQMGRMVFGESLIGKFDNGVNNPGNWIVRPSGRLVSVDNADAFSPEFTPQHMLRAEGISLSSFDLADVRRRIEALRPEFARLGRVEWHDDMLRRLDAIGPPHPAAPAKKATAAKAAKKAVPKPPPVPDRMTAPALRKELSAAGAPEELLAGVPQPVLARHVTTLRQTGDPLGAGRLRQDVIDRRRALAEALAEAAELLDSQASKTVLSSRAASRLRRVEELVKGWPQEAPLRSLVTAMQAGSPAAIRRAIATAERRGAVKRIGPASGDVTTYDRKAMSPLGGEKIPDGAQVRVVRPGYEVDIAGERVVLMRPVVEIATGVDALPRVATTPTPTVAAKATNPGFGTTRNGPIYRTAPVVSTSARTGRVESRRWDPSMGPPPYGAFEENCTNVVLAWDMRMRGFDVQAAPLDILDRHGYAVGRTSEEIDAFLTTAYRMLGGSPHGRTLAGQRWRSFDEIDAEIMREWPDGARGAIFVGKHVFSVTKSAGRVQYIEAQFDASASRVVTAQYKRTYRSTEFRGSRRQEAKVVRLDDLVPAEGILQAVQVVQ